MKHHLRHHEEAAIIITNRLLLCATPPKLSHWPQNASRNPDQSRERIGFHEGLCDWALLSSTVRCIIWGYDTVLPVLRITWHILLCYICTHYTAIIYLHSFIRLIYRFVWAQILGGPVFLKTDDLTEQFYELTAPNGNHEFSLAANATWLIYCPRNKFVTCNKSAESNRPSEGHPASIIAMCCYGWDHTEILDTFRPSVSLVTTKGEAWNVSFLE